jgi:acyl-CoA synthetase (AMP-forming)/AMP-acid ligase II
MSNIALLLETRAAEYPERKALVWTERARARHWTYAELQQRVEGIAAGFRSHGLTPGDRALIFVPMSPELYVLLLGLWRAGGTAVFLDPWSTPRQMAEVCKTMQPRWFAGPPAAALFLCRHRALRRIPHRIRTGKLPLFRAHALHRFASPDACPVEPRSPDDPALVTFTSGTTGSPKGANRTHGFLVAQHTALEHNLRADDGSGDLSHFPIFVLNSLASGKDYSRAGRAQSHRFPSLFRCPLRRWRGSALRTHRPHRRRTRGPPHPHRHAPYLSEGGNPHCIRLH